MSIDFAEMLSIQRLSSLSEELRLLKEHRPLTKREDGKYEGDILGFVKGLRLSAQIIYCLREWLHPSQCAVNWGHIINDGKSCSPECDVIIHTPGVERRWNGGNPAVMDFVFVRSENVKAVVSCKSIVNSVDADYPPSLQKYGVENVYLFGECCSQTNFENLKSKAKEAGYKDFWCTYFTTKDSSFIRDETVYVDFRNAIRAHF